MPDDISPTGWFVVLCALALGFGLVKFLFVSMSGDRTDSPGGTKHARPHSSASGASTEDSTSASHHRTEEPGSRQERVEPSTGAAWYDVLGVPADAPWDAVRSAYKKKMAMYHPDKVSALGPEFAVIAERMSKDINAAYERARAVRG